ncbi:MAG: cytochrome C [Polaromonas sp. 24-62-144]|uniref:c-type cytochrome n=1 Tax=Polaromonas sp. TaxID=1869339 RepID=UPI000BD9D021|nr:c-type cytochrome [Polaromonas sp.]OYZ80147.1 MAG: cytochrome C [Polaromonas sp. 24-62-144]HQS30267.1 c-type cytochrome [Polaromonas sp.]
MKFHQLFVPLVAGFLSLALLPASGQDIAAGKAKAQACAACHGADGNSPSGQFPNLAGQTWRYIYIQLKDYKEGRRTDPVMTPMATSLSRQEMIDIANYFAAQPAKPSTYKTDDAKIKLGKAKADETLCSMCHLGAFAGQNEIPRVAGQQYDYVVKQLRDFKARKRTNDAGNMTSVAQTLSDADIENLAQYITSLR